ncbi:MAG: cytochrome c3 family protein [Leptolinea sp.]
MLFKPKYLTILLIVAVTALLALVAIGCAPAVATEAAKAPEAAKPSEASVIAKATDAPAASASTPVEAPFLKEWQASAHNNVTGEQFRHWDAGTPAEVPVTCAGCHTSAGFLERAKTGKVTTPVAAKDAQGVTCDTCHNAASTALTSVTFPSGAVVSNLGGEARCMTCHQGRESKVSVDKQIADFNATDPDAIVAPMKVEGKDVAFGFRNVHYFAAAATLYGTEVKGGYEYDGKTYDAKNDHAGGLNTCISCHDQHTLEVKVDTCKNCHTDVKTVEDLKKVREPSSSGDYDGDGNVKEGMGEEIVGLQELLMAQIQKYAKDKVSAEIKYDGATYPYFMGADGKAYPNWTPRLLKAAYNYQVSIKDPGSFAHGNKYIVQLLHDSIEDLGGDVTKLAREDAGHFAGNTMAFRDWDETKTVPFACVKCHTAEGLPTFLKNGGSTVVTATGTTVTTGLGSAHPSNGFQCTTCHNEAKWPENYAIASVTFPSGKTVSLGGKDADGKFVADKNNVCISCHMGRESTTSVNNAMKGKEADTVDPKAPIGFKNVHYFAAGATLFGGDVMGAYQYADQKYVGLTAHPVAKCVDCHDKHSLTVKEDTCKTCHAGATTVDDIRNKENVTDYDGDSNVTEGMKGEIDTMAEALFAEIQAYADKKGVPLVYDTAAYPYFFADKDKDGKADKDDKGVSVGYTAFSPRLLEAAFNYQYVQKDPGAFVHNPKYVIQFLYDSIKDLGGNVSKYTRP